MSGVDDTERAPEFRQPGKRTCETIGGFTEGVTVHLTAHQRRFVANKTSKGLAAARVNRERILAKYPDNPDAGRGVDYIISSLTRLAYKLGLDDDDLDTP